MIVVKNVKKILLLACALFCVMVAYAFNESDLYGKWNPTRVEYYDRDKLKDYEDAPDEAGTQDFMIFNRDHSVEISEIGSGGWRMNADNLILYLDSDGSFMDNAKITIKNLNSSRLVLEFWRPNKNERIVMYFKKSR